jgi:hypothetical protein
MFGFRLRICLPILIALDPSFAGASSAATTLADLFADWRAFEAPPLLDGAPDYTAATTARRHAELPKLRARLEALDTAGWTVEQQVDLELVRAEMNGFDFQVRVLKPWERDPAFYASVWEEQSDTPAHEGVNPHHVVDLWTYAFPLSPAAQARLAAELRPIPAFLAQARRNLTGNARDLWTTGTASMRAQARTLADLESKLTGAGAEVRRAAGEARRATEELAVWLETQTAAKSGPSGIGKEAYSWNLRHVHRVEMSWEDEVTLLRRELARAHATLKLEEERNRALPALLPAADAAEYERRADRSIRHYLDFLRDRKLHPMRPTMEPSLRAKKGSFAPLDRRGFFAIAMHHEPATLYTHFTHWWDLDRMRDEPHPSPVRRGPLLYNIWDGRSEGMATAMEEWMLHAGLYDDNPRAREVVWILLAQRAARGLASLYLQANESPDPGSPGGFDIAAAKAFQIEWTPRGWMRADLDLANFEQQLYLRQPGYGTSYVTGKYELEQLIAELAKRWGDGFTMERFFAEVNAAGMIPVSLVRSQLTGVAPAAR